MRKRNRVTPIVNRKRNTSRYSKSIISKTTNVINRIQLNIPTVGTRSLLTAYGGWNKSSSRDSSPKKDFFVFEGQASSSFSSVAKLEVGTIKDEDDKYGGEAFYFISEPKINYNSGGCVVKSEVVDKKFNSEGRLIYCCLKIRSKKVSKDSTPSVVDVNYKIKKIKFDNTRGGIKSRDKQIHDITFSKQPILSKGEKREFNITGVPGSKFQIAINETKPTEITDGGNSYLQFNKSEDQSIISKRGAMNIEEGNIVKESHDYGKELDTIKGVVGKDGSFRFTQSFPSVVIVKLKKNGSGGTTAHEFYSNVGVEDGDRLVWKGLDSKNEIKVSNVNSNGTTINTNKSVTIPNNTVVEVHRSRYYSIDFIEHLCDKLGGRISKENPSYTIPQYRDIVVTIKNKPSVTTYTITHQNGVATGLNPNDDYDIAFAGKAGQVGSGRNSTDVFKVRLTLTMAIGNFEDKVLPTWSSKDQEKSFWENSVTLDNNGTHVEISNIALGNIGSSTIDFDYNIRVYKYGTESLDITLLMQQIVSHIADSIP